MGRITGEKVSLLIFILLVILVAAILGIGVKFLGITGHFGYSNSYSDLIENDYYSNSVYLWTPQENIPLETVSISGTAKGTGKLKISLYSGQDSYTILNLDLQQEEANFTNYYSNLNSINLPQSDKYVLRIEVDNLYVYLESITYSDFPVDSGFLSRGILDPSYYLNEINNLNETNTSNYINVSIIYENVSNEVVEETFGAQADNQKPYLENIEFDPYTPNNLSNLDVIGNYYDDDNDNSTIYSEWYVNDFNVFNESKGYINGSQFTLTLNKSFFNYNDSVNVTLYADDSKNRSAIYNLNSIVSNESITINSITLANVGLGKANSIEINATSNSNIASGWVNITNQNISVIKPLNSLLGLWMIDYVSNIQGNHYVDIFLQTTGGSLEHQKVSYQVESDIEISIVTEKKIYGLNELVNLIGLP